jgi:hypothetical protein
MTTIKHILPLIGAGLALAGAGAPLAQGAEFKSAREIANFLGERMPPFLKDDALRKQLVGDMLSVKPTRLAFDPNTAIKLLMGDGSVLPSTDCRRTGTPVGERDPGDCTASIGDEAGAGAFSRLSYSKSIGFGNIKFVKRPAVPTELPDPEKLPSPKLSDAEAYDAARKLLAELGLPRSELPDVPGNATGGLPVRNLIVQGGGEKPSAPIIVQKVVFQQRGFELGNKYSGGQGLPDLTHAPAPGKAMVMFDASGIAGVAVQGWADLRLEPGMTAEDSKSGEALMDEISEDLFNEGVRSAEDMKVGILIGMDQRNQIGLLLPAVQVAVVPGGVLRNPSAAEQERLAGRTTGGLIKEYALVNRKQDSSAGRPRGD